MSSEQPLKSVYRSANISLRKADLARQNADDDEEPIWLTEEPTPPKAASKKRTNRVAWPEKAKEKEEKEQAGSSSRKSARTPKPKWPTK